MEYKVQIAVNNKLYERIAGWMAERGVKEFKVRVERDERKRNVVKVLVDGEEVAVVRVRTEGGAVFHVYGKLANELGRKAVAQLENVEKRRAEPYQSRALLATDGGYKAKKGIVYASTTSILQAALYKYLGMRVYYAGYASLTRDGLKPVFEAQLPRDEGGERWVQLIKADLENGVKALSSDRALRGALAGLALGLLGRIEISVKGAYGEEGRRKAAEVKRVIMERIEYFARLRLGEGGAVCLANCRFGEKALTYEHEAYARVIASLLHYIAEDAPKEEVMKFLVYTILFDGYVSPNKVLLVVGHFGARKKQLPLDVYDKLALYIILAAKYGVAVEKVYIERSVAEIRFNSEYAVEMFTTTWGELSWLSKFGRKYGLFADHIFKKLRRKRKSETAIIEIAGVEMSVVSREREAGRSRWLEIKYKPRLAEAFEAALNALEAAGFEEGLHFTAERPKDGQQGYVYLKLPAGLWKLVELERAGVEWAKEALDRLREIAKARGFYDLLQEYLKPAEEAETLDPKKVVAEDPERGIRAVIRDLRREWINGRPRIIVEYEANGEKRFFFFTWGVVKGGSVQAGVDLNDVKAVVLAALTGDESIKGKEQVTLTARHLFAFARYKGIGWDLLWWYAR